MTEDGFVRAEDEDLEHRTVRRALDRLRGWGYEQASESLVWDVLRHAFADERLEDPLDAETVICCDCAVRARPSCERDGHGLVTLDELIDAFANPQSDRTGGLARLHWTGRSDG